MTITSSPVDGFHSLLYHVRFKWSQGAERGGCEKGVLSPPEERSGEGLDPPQKIVLLFNLKIEHFGAEFKSDLTEETRTQLQEEEEFASSCLILATPMSEV